VNKTWNDSDLARLSADLDNELNSIFEQVETVLSSKNDQWADNEQIGASGGSYEAGQIEEMDGEPDSDSLPAIAPANLLTEEHFLSEDLDIDVTLGNESPFDVPETTGDDWLEPGLLGEPEIPAGLTPEVIKELSRIIEAAVEKGVASALAKMKDKAK
jgi:hypothetical protein